MNLDNTDVKILKVLQDNGRLSFRQIADRVKVSVPTVSSKVGALEDLGVVKGYSANIDAEKLGGISVILNIKTKPVDIKKVAERFQSDENVRKMFILSNGKLLVVCTFTQQHLINEFITNLADVHEIIEYDIANIVNVVKEDQRAVVNHESSVVPQCAQCGKDVRENEVKTKAEDKDHYFCSTSCQKAFHSKMEPKSERSKAKA